MTYLLSPTPSAVHRQGRLIPKLRLALLLASFALPIAAIAFALSFRDPEVHQFLILYVAPLLATIPVWVRMRLDDLATSIPATRLLDFTVLAVSAARFIALIAPVSGHMLFLTYSLLTTPARWYAWVAGALLVETSVFKLFLWDDPFTWGAGLALGAMAAGVHRFCLSWASRLTRA